MVISRISSLRMRQQPKDDWLLKANHFGRATFLPLTSVRANRNTKNEAALGEKGVLGIANKLVKCDPKFDEVVAYLLGRVIVVDTIDNAIALAKKITIHSIL